MTARFPRPKAGRPTPPRFRPTLFEFESRAVPAVLTVTNLSDADPGSLRAQIAAADPGDTITFAASLNGSVLALTSGELDLSKNLTVAGPGAGQFTITTAGDFRAFGVLPGAAVTLSGLTVAGVDTSGPGAVAFSLGSLTVRNCNFRDNSALDTGGAIFNQGGTLRINGCQFTGNSSAAFGGAVVNYEGSAAIRNSSFVGNQCANDGGAVFNTVNPEGPLTTRSTVTIDNCTFRLNDAGAGGGGVLNEGQGVVTMTIRGSTFENNHAGISGGGVYNNSDMTVTGCTIADNTSDGRGGGLYASQNPNFPLDHQVPMHLTVDGCTIIRNHSLSPALISTTTGAPPGGGGVFVATRDGQDTIAVSNCTIADNDATTSGAGVYVFLRADTSAASFTNCTIVGNSLRNVEDGTYNSGYGGGLTLDARDGGVITLTSCTVADNSARDGGNGTVVFNNADVVLRNTLVARNAGGPVGPDVFGVVDASSSYNLIGEGTDLSGIGDGSNGNRIGTAANPIDPRLGPLQDNGGPTYTRELLAGSPALNAGDPSLLGTPDQRGVMRTGGVNVGSYQASAAGFGLSVDGPIVAGEPFTVLVEAVDRYGQVAYGYTGTVYLFDFDPQATYLDQNAFAPEDGGRFRFDGVVLDAAGDQQLVALDGTNAGAVDVTVLPA